jgi:hypothetical protein
LTSLDWQVHVYGDADPDLIALCRDRSIPLHVFAWREDRQSAGLRRDAIYLVRPDGYVALAADAAAAPAVASYFETRMLTPTIRR